MSKIINIKENKSNDVMVKEKDKRFFYKANSKTREELIGKLEEMKTTVNGTEKNYEILPGTEYSRYAIPLDYLPSRKLEPRKNKIEKLDEWFQSYIDEYQQMLEYFATLDLSNIKLKNTDGNKPEAAWVGGCVAPFDTLALYAMVSKYQPKHYVEIGSGMTTCFARQAIKDHNLQTKVISIDPNPRMWVDKICDEVYRYGLEEFDVNKLDFMEENDILFFDGSHRCFMNSDVTVFFLEILPKLKPGVIIHLHDIMLPDDYPDMFVNWYWNEQYMLATLFLNAMDIIKPLLPTHWICTNEKLKNYIYPFVDLGEQNDGWLGGGSMWFSFMK